MRGTRPSRKQIHWRGWRRDLNKSADGRFVIARTTSGFTVSDLATGDLTRTTTLPLAHAWAGNRVGEQVVHRATDVEAPPTPPDKELL
jgi:hypothetical protein